MAGFQNISIIGQAGSTKQGKSDHAGSAGTSPQCPKCGSNKLWRDGNRYTPFGDKIQRWICRNCAHRFSDQIDVARAWSTFERVERIDTKPVKANSDRQSSGQICVTETKNVAAEQQTTEVLRRNETNDAKGKTVEYCWWLKKAGKSEATIRGRSKLLRLMVKRGASL